MRWEEQLSLSKIKTGRWCLTDQSGTRIFLGVSGAHGRPITSLPGDNSRKMSSFTIGINFNANGNAVTVSANNKTYSIENWNKYFTEQNAKSNVSTNYWEVPEKYRFISNRSIRKLSTKKRTGTIFNS
jgi:hypothetical protein